MGWDESIQPIKPLPFADVLKRGYTNFLKFPKWAWLFEVNGGLLSGCRGFTKIKLTDGKEVEFCREAYVRITDDNNQYVVIAHVETKPKSVWDTSHIEYSIEYVNMALVPRFLGILKDAEGYIIFYMADGKVADAVKSLDLSPSIVVNIINNYFSPPFYVITNEVVKDVLFSAIHKVNLMKLEPAVRDELVNQLKSVDEDVVFL